MSTFRWFAAGAATALVTAVAAVAVMAEEPPADAAKYVGDKVCMSCHLQEHKAWKKTGLASAMKKLAPTAEAEDKALFDKKKASGLDPAKDYTSDAACLKCHTTGYGTASGYPDVAALSAGDDAAKAEAAKRAKAFGSVGCESCHGAGSKYVAFKKTDANKTRKEIPFEELAPHGLVKPDEALCKTCHGAGGPTKEDFKFEEAKGKTHAKEEKK